MPAAIARSMLVVVLAVVPAATAVAAESDPLRDRQWGLERVQAPRAWPASRGAGVVVAVLDTGVSLTHEDLRDKIVQGRDVVAGTDVPEDRNGHGTAIAGIAAAATDNGRGIAGVAPDALILPVRVLDDHGWGTETDVAAGIAYAVTRAADMRSKLVVALALADVPGVRPSPTRGQAISQAVRSAYARGAVVVFASGASGAMQDQARDMSLWVGAVDAADERKPDTGIPVVLAPGDEILTTARGPGGDDYTCADAACHGGAASGTSYAASHAAGVAALMMAQGASNREVLDRIVQTADPLRGGLGRVNAARAVGVRNVAGDASAPPAPTQAPNVPGESQPAAEHAQAQAAKAAPARPAPAPTPVPNTPVSEHLPSGRPAPDPQVITGWRLAIAAAAWIAAAILLFGMALLYGRRRPPPTLERAGIMRPGTFDGVRGLAALWVVGLHTLNVLRPPGDGLPAVLWPFASGALGVDVFFVLSGFLLVQSWMSIRDRALSAFHAVRVFAVRRVLRILPAFLVAAAVLVPLFAPELLRAPVKVALIVTMQQFLQPALPWTFDGPTWSLTTEVHFYILLPVVALLMRRAGRARTVVILLALSVAWRFYTRNEYLWPSNLFFGRIDQLAIGMFLGLATITGARSRLRDALASRWGGRITTVAFATLVVVYGHIYGGAKTGLSSMAEVFVHPLAGLLIAAIFVRLASGPRIRALEWWPLTSIGTISYSLYLCHVPLLAVAKNGPDVGLRVAAAVGASFVIATLGYLFVEAPLLGPRTPATPGAPKPAGTRPPSRVARPAPARRLPASPR